MTTISAAVAACGFTLPDVDQPVANYLAHRRIGNCLLISGQISLNAGTPWPIGRLGDTLSVEQGYLAAQSAALQLLAQLADAADDQINQVQSVLRLGVFIASAPGFDEHSQVANGASDLLVRVLGDAGRHARTAVGVASLPAGVAVEIDAMIALVGDPADSHQGG
jgi:enamine deaminase RidA (YjgF/YER057c/UK114 family)